MLFFLNFEVSVKCFPPFFLQNIEDIVFLYLTLTKLSVANMEFSSVTCMYDSFEF